MDLTLHFDTQAVVDKLGANSPQRVRLVTVMGNLKEEFGGTPIIGEDVVLLVGK